MRGRKEESEGEIDVARPCWLEYSAIFEVQDNQMCHAEACSCDTKHLDDGIQSSRSRRRARCATHTDKETLSTRLASLSASPMQYCCLSAQALFTFSSTSASVSSSSQMLRQHPSIDCTATSHSGNALTTLSRDFSLSQHGVTEALETLDSPIMSTNIFRDSYAGDPSDNEAAASQLPKQRRASFMNLLEEARLSSPSFSVYLVYSADRVCPVCPAISQLSQTFLVALSRA